MYVFCTDATFEGGSNQTTESDQEEKDEGMDGVAMSEEENSEEPPPNMQVLNILVVYSYKYWLGCTIY